jgi:hypothetical protein
MKNLKKQQTANADAKARRRAIARWENEGGKVLAEVKKLARVRRRR